MAGHNATRLASVLPTAPLAGTNPRCWFEPAVISDVAAGAAADGNTLVTVTWRGASYDVPYLSSYAPVVGHTVLLLVQPPQVVIAGRVLGRP